MAVKGVIQLLYCFTCWHQHICSLKMCFPNISC